MNIATKVTKKNRIENCLKNIKVLKYVVERDEEAITSPEELSYLKLSIG